RLDDPLSSLDLQPLTVVKKTTTIKDAVGLMMKNKVGCVLVTESGKLVGILTERDLIRRVMGRGLDHSAETTGSHMTGHPEYLRMEDSVAHALNHMYDRGYRHVPIVDEDKKPEGFVSMRDIVYHLAAFYEKDILNLPPRPVRKASAREGG
ncbi:MAG: CBS domain-containing protein, partial [Candidatus Marinimicrobia bacterium]|nr:CBS domain-containing protein [Candidatus Neomarinimicrobiota bacterium]